MTCTGSYAMTTAPLMDRATDSAAASTEEAWDPKYTHCNPHIAHGRCVAHADGVEPERGKRSRGIGGLVVGAAAVHNRDRDRGGSRQGVAGHGVGGGTDTEYLVDRGLVL